VRRTSLLRWAICSVIFVAAGCSSNNAESVPESAANTVANPSALWTTTIATDETSGGQVSFTIQNRSEATVQSPIYLILQSRKPEASDWATVGYVPFSGTGANTKLCVDLTECEFAASYAEIPPGGTDVWWLPRSALPPGTYRALIRDIEPEAQNANEFELT